MSLAQNEPTEQGAPALIRAATLALSYLEECGPSLLDAGMEESGCDQVTKALRKALKATPAPSPWRTAYACNPEELQETLNTFEACGYALHSLHVLQDGDDPYGFVVVARLREGE